MKPTYSAITRLFSILLFLFTLSIGSIQAQETAKLQLESLDKLASRATEVVRKEEKALHGDGMVYVRHFEFKQSGDYKESDLQEIRAQLQSSGWSRFLKAGDKNDDPEENEHVEVYIFGKTEGSDIYEGMTIIVTEPKEVTVVNIVGQGDIKQIMKMAKQGKSSEQEE